MPSEILEPKKAPLPIRLLGLILLPALWLLIKDVFGISDRYLPSFRGVVIDAVFDIEPNVLWHLFMTTSRLVFGFVFGLAGGIALGLAVFRSPRLFVLMMPGIQTMRSIPPIAVIPFFLLWFGFSEVGRYLLVIFGTALNIAIAALQILQDSPEKYKIMFRSYGLNPRTRVFAFALPMVSERLLPTLRFSLSTAIGLIVVSELLGSQTGLGYLIQTSRATFSLHVVFLSALLLGVLNVTADWALRYIWTKVTYWT